MIIVVKQIVDKSTERVTFTVSQTTIGLSSQ